LDLLRAEGAASMAATVIAHTASTKRMGDVMRMVIRGESLSRRYLPARAYAAL
jgi:hypothetical protein